MSFDSAFWEEAARRFRAIPEFRVNWIECGWGTAVSDTGGDRWTLDGPPPSVDAFTSQAVRAAVAAGLPPSVDAWLDRLRERKIGFARRGVIASHRNGETTEAKTGEIERACEMSALYCDARESEEFAREHHRQALPPETIPTSGDLPNRASFLYREMKRRRVTKTRLSTFGIDKRTIGKILSGESVREDALDRLAEALTACGQPPVSIRQIPND
jgi:hypothetical protein